MERTSGDPIWEQALDLISQQVNEGTYRIWFEPTIGLGLQDGTYSVGVASDFARDWIDTRFRTLMADSVAQVLGRSVAFNIVVSPGLARPDSSDGQTKAPAPATAADRDPRRRSYAPRVGGGGTRPAASSDAASGSTPASGASLVSAERLPAMSGLMGKYTFDTFVIGPSNRFAHAAALAAAETPGTKYNPLFIYGGVGLGKTHLIQAIGNYALRNHPDLKVRYVTLETFTNDFINSPS